MHMSITQYEVWHMTVVTNNCYRQCVKLTVHVHSTHGTRGIEPLKYKGVIKPLVIKNWHGIGSRSKPYRAIVC